MRWVLLLFLWMSLFLWMCVKEALWMLIVHEKCLFTGPEM